MNMLQDFTLFLDVEGITFIHVNVMKAMPVHFSKGYNLETINIC